MTGAVHMLPAWRNAAAELFSGKFSYGDVVTHAELQGSLRLPKPTGLVVPEAYERWRLDLLSQIAALSEWLLEEKSMCLSNVQGQGYMVVKPEQQTEYAVKQGRKAIRSELRKMARRLTYIDHAALSQEDRRKNADALARLSFMDQQFKQAKRRRFIAPPDAKIECK